MCRFRVPSLCVHQRYVFPGERSNAFVLLGGENSEAPMNGFSRDSPSQRALWSTLSEDAGSWSRSAPTGRRRGFDMSPKTLRSNALCTSFFVLSSVALSGQDLPEYYVGVWEGIVTQANGIQYPSRIELVDGLVGDVLGRFEYPTLCCGGSLTLTRVADRQVELGETYNFSSCQSCVTAPAHVTVTELSSDEVKWDWRAQRGEAVFVTGTLLRQDCPLPEFSVSINQGPAPLVVTFDAVDSPLPEDGDIERFDWDLGDGVTTEDERFVHEYTEPGIYEVSLQVTYSNGCSRRTSELIVVTCPEESVDPWISTDVGEPELPGGAHVSDGEVVVCAGGSGFGNRSDQFHFVFREVIGDFDLTVTVPAGPDSPGVREFGLMARQSLGAGSPYASALVQQTLGSVTSRFRARSETDGSAVRKTGERVSFPVSLQLRRRQDEFVALVSTAGRDGPFEEIGRLDFQAVSNAAPIPTTLLVGVALASGNRAGGAQRAAYARFADVRIDSPAGAGPEFVRGDCNGDAGVDLADAVCALTWLFGGGEVPHCVAATDVNGDGSSDLADAVSLLNHLFQGGPAPSAPFPDCGPGRLEADRELGCLRPVGCDA